MEKGSKVVVVNGFLHGLHGEIVAITNDGIECRFHLSPTWGDFGLLTTTLKPHDLELEERKDLWNRLI